MTVGIGKVSRNKYRRENKWLKQKCNKHINIET